MSTHTDMERPRHPEVYFAGLLQPLPIGVPNFRERVDSLLAAMSADILGRVLDDKLEEDRYPLRLQSKPAVSVSRGHAPLL